MSLITLTIRQCQLCKSLNGQWRYVPWLALDHWKGSLLQNRASVDVIRPAATFHSSDATVVIGRRLSYPCPSRALFYNYAPLLPASSYFNSYLHRHVLLYDHVCHHGRNTLWIHNSHFFPESIFWCQYELKERRRKILRNIFSSRDIGLQLQQILILSYSGQWATSILKTETINLTRPASESRSSFCTQCQLVGSLGCWTFGVSWAVLPFNCLYKSRLPKIWNICVFFWKN